MKKHTDRRDYRNHRQKRVTFDPPIDLASTGDKQSYNTGLTTCQKW